ncbi:FadR/GntR family transcriptional regulator [Streptomyces sp. NPDC056061]|uniref:FadR/GntR family transcriptional regulator n=1 Tax=Streptomyces sp. NPDC056061 TaxID=3345700 RepID=UPI0035DC8518
MPVTDEAIDKIKAVIVSGELRPGSRLPREPDLAERLGLSRNSLREAVKALSIRRVLDVRQGDGTYVTSLEPDLLLDALTFVADLQQDDTVLQFLEVRRILEPAAAAMAARSMPDEEITALGEVLDRLDGGLSLDVLIENDLEFHRRLAAGSGNAVLCSLLEGMAGPTVRARLWRGRVEGRAVARARQQHRAIYEAVAARQPDSPTARQPDVAQAWATVHVAEVEQWQRGTLGTGEPAPV